MLNMLADAGKAVGQEAFTVIRDAGSNSISKVTDQFLEQQSEKLTAKGATVETTGTVKEKPVESVDPKPEPKKDNRAAIVAGVVVVAVVLYVVLDVGKKGKK